MSETKPTRERVEAYEKGLGCGRDAFGEPYYCKTHHGFKWTDLGCPVAVAAARVEAERVQAAKAEALRGAAERWRAERPNTQTPIWPEQLVQWADEMERA
jgi:hypothetical protein